MERRFCLFPAAGKQKNQQLHFCKLLISRAENERATFASLYFVHQTIPFELAASLVQIETVARHFSKPVSALVKPCQRLFVFGS